MQASKAGVPSRQLSWTCSLGRALRCLLAHVLTPRLGRPPAYRAPPLIHPHAPTRLAFLPTLRLVPQPTLPRREPPALTRQAPPPTRPHRAASPSQTYTPPITSTRQLGICI